MVQKFEHKYNIGDIVFYITPESDSGMIIDISYSARANEVRYEVTFGRRLEDNIWCYESELAESKQF